MTLVWPDGWLVRALGARDRGCRLRARRHCRARTCQPKCSTARYGADRRPHRGWIPIGQLVATGLALILPGWRCLWLARRRQPAQLAIWGVLLRHREARLRHRRGQRTRAVAHDRRAAPTCYLTGAATFLLWSMQYFAYMTWLPQYLVEIVGLGASATALGYALPVIVLLVFNLMTGALLGAASRWRLLVGAAIAGGHLVADPHDAWNGRRHRLSRHLWHRRRHNADLPVRPAGDVLGRAGAPTAFGYRHDRAQHRRLSGPRSCWPRPPRRSAVGGRSGRCLRNDDLVAVAAAFGLAVLLRRANRPIRAPADSRPVRSPGSRPARDRARSSGAAGRHGSRACAS